MLHLHVIPSLSLTNIDYKMTVETPHMTLSPCQFLRREMNATTYDDRPQTAYGMAPLHATNMEKIIPVTNSFPTPAFMADSGITCNLPLSRKRPRNDHSSSFREELNGRFAFLNEDIASHIYQKELEIDRFIAHHTEKVSTEIEEMRRRNSRRLIAAAEDNIMKRLKAKEEEIVKIGQLNRCLEEKLKSLNVENQIWRELAQTNEATANDLRNNLQQLVAQLQFQQQYPLDFTDNVLPIDDAQSHCGSKDQLSIDGGGDESNSRSRYGGMRGRCRSCLKEESCVLLLPCRHLCICSMCASSISICPVCKSTKSVGVHVNMN
ncbi:hypothetical protein LXL04_016066 [Taraxacum kok-saghyz]